MMLKSLIFLSLLGSSLVSAEDKKLRFPVVLPPYGIEGGAKASDMDKYGDCLLYMENLGIVVFQGKDSNPSAWAGVISPQDPKNTFNWNEANVNCVKNQTADPKKFTAQPFTFVVDVTTSGDGVPAKQKDKTLFTLKGNYKFTLIFETIVGYGWQLKNVTNEEFTVESGDWLKSKLTVKKGEAQKTSVGKMEIGAYKDYNFGCSSTKAAIFPVDGQKDIYVGVYFGNIQVQKSGLMTSKDKSSVHFSFNTADCVGTFTHGSLMGIIVSLVLISVLAFGFLMLNSVQGVDRFDDPKQKQLLINAKE